MPKTPDLFSCLLDHALALEDAESRLGPLAGAAAARNCLDEKRGSLLSPEFHELAFYFLFLFLLWVRKGEKSASVTSSFSVMTKKKEKGQEKSRPWETPGYYYFLIRQKMISPKPLAKMRSPPFSWRLRAQLQLQGERILPSSGGPSSSSSSPIPRTLGGLLAPGCQEEPRPRRPPPVLGGISVTPATLTLFLGAPFPALSILNGRWGGVKYLREARYLLRI